MLADRRVTDFLVSEFSQQSAGHQCYGICCKNWFVLPDDLCISTACLHFSSAVHEFFVWHNMAKVSSYFETDSLLYFFFF